MILSNEDKFDKWNDIKKKTDKQNIKNVSIGHIYWVGIGQNIGGEVYGKGDKFTRPVLVISKIQIKNYLNLFVGVPISSKLKKKTGFMYHKFEDSKGIQQVALLAQIRVFDTKRVISYNSKISDAKLKDIKDKISNDIISQH
ncbi:putative toxin-antitoxin system, toxin component, PemK family [Campylobacter iguaniorum]|uniref:type II toxin-antitoxin system PemK/MazF family toxin n=1 Tax=Campylobacter iguaniorum TaxID=1244531 RepID=UPI00073AA521|nr:type II toxin-antitoxin system PemK/MazF family toxin [Campylobacter iguaniorum]ALV24940.1 putative toxin-antitoxin system, toxin component, PemK family [Campylobacter iguaniorum]